jgi:hypothetical protein
MGSIATRQCDVRSDRVSCERTSAVVVKGCMLNVSSNTSVEEL